MSSKDVKNLVSIPCVVAISIISLSMAAHVLGSKDEEHIIWLKANLDAAIGTDLADTITCYLGCLESVFASMDTICQLCRICTLPFI